jgi:hypothetical protein
MNKSITGIFALFRTIDNSFSTFFFNTLNSPENKKIINLSMHIGPEVVKK